MVLEVLDFSLALMNYARVPLYFEHYQLNCRDFLHLEEDEHPF